MAVKVFCPNPTCGASYSIAADDMGRMGRCRDCGTEFEMGPATTWGAGHGETIPLGEPDGARGVPGALGPQFGRYKIAGKLGQGGMGAVYLAHDELLDRPVALKMPHFNLGGGPEVVGRFLREARAAAAFHHPNFCPIFDVGEIDGTQFLAMAYIEGQTLGEVLERDRAMAPKRAAETARQLALALAEAHRRGIVHRDLKPSNVMIDARGTLIIMDFGVARRAGTEDVEWTRPGALLGTPHYMSPEQVRGDKDATGPGIDIYALGVILYQLLAGRRPFEGPISLVLGMIAIQDPERPSAYRPGVDPKLEAICLKAMARRLEDRYPSMEALASALESYLARLAAVQDSDSWPKLSGEAARTLISRSAVIAPLKPPAKPPARPSRLVPVLATLAVLLGAIGLAGFLLVQNGVIPLGSATPAAASGTPGPPEVAATPRPTSPEPTTPANPPPAGSTSVDVPKQPPTSVVAVAPSPRPPTEAEPDPRRDAYESYSKGVAMLDVKDHAKAVARLDEAIRIDPTYAEAYYKRGLAREALGQPDRAADDASEAIRLDGNNADAFELRARVRIASKDYDRALADLDRAIEIAPRHADARDNRGAIFLARKDYDRAIVDFRQAINLEGEHPRAYLNRGLAFQAKGLHERAIADFTEALDNLQDEKVPDDARKASALFHRGSSYLEQKEVEKAVEDLEKSIQLDPKVADAHVNLGRADLEKKEYDKAIVHFKKAIKLEEDHARAYMNLGLAYDAKGDHPKAIANFTEAIDNDPSNAEAYMERGESRLALGDLARAIDDCTSALRINARLADAYDVRGVARYRKGEYDLAIADFTSATRFDSKHPNAFEGRGLAYLARKQYARAVESLDEALRVDPDDTSANSVLASILSSCPEDALRDGKRALALATRACERLDWKDAYALNALAEAHAELGQFPQAVRRQSEAIELLTDDPTRQNYQARLRLYEQGRPHRSAP